MLRETKGSVMADDPREILKAAGAECAEVEDYMFLREPVWCEECGRNHDIDMMTGLPVVRHDDADAAILSLARLVAKYKWIAERHESVVDRVIMDRKPQFDALEARWDERDA